MSISTWFGLALGPIIVFGFAWLCHSAERRRLKGFARRRGSAIHTAHVNMHDERYAIQVFRRYGWRCVSIKRHYGSRGWEGPHTVLKFVRS